MPSHPIRIAITRLAAGGDGVGRLDGKVVFVPLTAPGDIAAIEIAGDRGAFLRGRLLGLDRPSPQRVEPPCPLFGACGGCRWQHLAYPLQLEAKRSIVEEALRRIGHFEPPPIPGTMSSPAAYGYRHRVRLHVAPGGGRAIFGFFRAESREVVPTDRCAVLHPGLDALFPILNETAHRHPKLFAGCREVRADTDFEGRFLRLALRARDGRPLAVPADAQETLRTATAATATQILVGATAERPLRLDPEEEALETAGEAFTQANLRQNQNLVRLAMEMAAPVAGEEVLDLYCGLGNLSLPTVARGATVLGIDRDAEAVGQARANARRGGGVNAAFRQGDAAETARLLAGERRRFDLVLLNPPRTGARETVAILPAFAPSRILMISCDPATFARDAALFRERGYHLAAVRPLDMFPQTAHVETIGLFLPRP